MRYNIVQFVRNTFQYIFLSFPIKGIDGRSIIGEKGERGERGYTVKKIYYEVERSNSLTAISICYREHMEKKVRKESLAS